MPRDKNKRKRSEETSSEGMENSNGQSEIQDSNMASEPDTEGVNNVDKLFSITMAIQQTVNTILTKIDSQNDKIDSLMSDIHKSGGIEDRLQSVITETDDQTAEISELRSHSKTMTNKVQLLSSYVIRLEQRLENMQNKVSDLTGRSMRENIIVTGFEEKKRENLRVDMNIFFHKVLNISEAQKIKIDRVHRIGRYNNGPRPRSIVIKFHDYQDREFVLEKAKSLKQNGHTVRMYPQSPEETRENRKRLYDIQAQYNTQGVETKISGDKLIFKDSGNIHREKVPIPKAHDVLEYTAKHPLIIETGDSTSDNGNHFEARAVSIGTYSEAREGIRQILQIPAVAMCTHNILAYRFVDRDNIKHEGTDDDGEHGAAFNILKYLRDNNFNNVMVVVSRKLGQKLGPRRFTYISNAAKSVLEKFTCVSTHY